MKDALDKYASELAAAMAASDRDALARVGDRLVAAKREGRTVYLAGNGGSAATASHVANDLVKGCRVNGRTGFRAVCLADSSAILTCLANDFAYEDIFAIQLQTLATAGDILVAFSGSGNSPDILAALREARAKGVATIGFGGRDGGRMKELCDEFVLAPTWSMEMIEDLHLAYFHGLVCAMRERL